MYVINPPKSDPELEGQLRTLEYMGLAVKGRRRKDKKIDVTWAVKVNDQGMSYTAPPMKPKPEPKIVQFNQPQRQQQQADPLKEAVLSRAYGYSASSYKWRCNKCGHVHDLWVSPCKGCGDYRTLVAAYVFKAICRSCKQQYTDTFFKNCLSCGGKDTVISTEHYDREEREAEEARKARESNPINPANKVLSGEDTIPTVFNYVCEHCGDMYIYDHDECLSCKKGKVVKISSLPIAPAVKTIDYDHKPPLISCCGIRFSNNANKCPVCYKVHDKGEDIV